MTEGLDPAPGAGMAGEGMAGEGMAGEGDPVRPGDADVERAGLEDGLTPDVPRPDGDDVEGHGLRGR